MAKQDYRLKALLNLRERTKREKEEQLAVMKKKLRDEQQKAEELRKQHQEMKDNRIAKEEEITSQMQAGALNMNEYTRSQNYLKRLDREIEDFLDVIKEQDKKVVFAQQEVDWAFEEMIQANQECKALEKHKEKWEAQVKKERATKEALIQEEIAATIHLFKNK